MDDDTPSTNKPVLVSGRKEPMDGDQWFLDVTEGASVEIAHKVLCHVTGSSEGALKLYDGTSYIIGIGDMQTHYPGVDSDNKVSEKYGVGQGPVDIIKKQAPATVYLTLAVSQTAISGMDAVPKSGGDIQCSTTSAVTENIIGQFGEDKTTDATYTALVKVRLNPYTSKVGA